MTTTKTETKVMTNVTTNATTNHVTMDDMTDRTTDDITINIIIDVATQTLTLNLPYEQKTYTISTGKNGVGNQEGTGCTPLGKHIISDKIGADMPAGTVFVGREPTGEIYDDQLDKAYPDRDWILTRILWLAGVEEGINKGNNQHGCCDTHARYIYIHGTPPNQPMGVPMSHGCIRMRDDDLIELFDSVQVGTPVDIINMNQHE